MPFTAPVLNIGQGLANGILAGADSLTKSIEYVRDQYTAAKQAQGAMAALGSMKDSSGNPMVPQSVVDMFNKQSPQGQSAIAGLFAQRATNIWNMQNQMALQGNQGDVEQKTHAANTVSDIESYTNRNLPPPGVRLPAGGGGGGTTTNGGGGNSPLTPANTITLKINGQPYHAPVATDNSGRMVVQGPDNQWYPYKNQVPQF